MNIIMENCAGQNKNRMVLRLAPLLVELEWYFRVNMIFLVAGHTKNAADRLFNLLKKEYRLSNIYNMEMLVNALSKHELIDAIKVGEDDFRDWDVFLNSLYIAMPSGVVKQYQYFHSSGFKKGWLQAQASCAQHAEGVKVDLTNTTSVDATERVMLLSDPFDICEHVAKLVPPGI
jgi:hypothetical protein